MCYRWPPSFPFRILTQPSNVASNVVSLTSSLSSHSQLISLLFVNISACSALLPQDICCFGFVISFLFSSAAKTFACQATYGYCFQNFRILFNFYLFLKSSPDDFITFHCPLSGTCIAFVILILFHFICLPFFFFFLIEPRQACLWGCLCPCSQHTERHLHVLSFKCVHELTRF